MDRRMLLLVASVVLCWAAVPASAQHFKPVLGSLAQVAAGRNEVWGLDASNQVYRFNAATKTFAKTGTLKLTRIAVGGGSLLQTDQVWGVNATGNIYKFNFKTNTFGHIPGTLAQIVVGEGYVDKCHPYEVWGLNAAELIFRFNSCMSQFEQVAGSLTVIATGGAGDVWGLNSSAQIYHYSFVSQRFYQVPGSLQQIIVGVNDVWGTDGSSTLYRYSLQPEQFALMAYLGVGSQIVAGGDGFWILAEDGSASLFQPNFQAFGFTVPGVITQLAVGYGAGVWAVDSAHHIYTLVRP